MANKPHSRAYKRILSNKWITYQQMMLKRSETLKTNKTPNYLHRPLGVTNNNVLNSFH